MSVSFREHVDGYFGGGRASVRPEIEPVAVTVLLTEHDYHEWVYSGPHAMAGRCTGCDTRRYLVEEAGRLVSEFHNPTTGAKWRESEVPTC